MGEFIPFVELCGESAEIETREILVSASLRQDAVPTGTYALLESYCADTDCDCRKVMISMISKESQKMLATIGYGWENEQFYIDWMSGDEEMGRKLTGAYLEPGGKQSHYARACLQLFQQIVANEPSLVDSMKRHYKIFRQRLR
ncbi:MAG: hypothetical protein AAB539_01715 [Patescibacteria group bacterium]